MSNVDHPNHYNIPGRKECIDEMLEKFGAEKVKAFCELNAYKYRYRHEMKNGEEDLEKAEWYEKYKTSLEDAVWLTKEAYAELCYKASKWNEIDYISIMNIIPGTTIELGGIEMEIIDSAYPSADGKELGVLCLTKNILFEKSFDEGNNNNWEKSSLRKYLNGEYKESLNEELAGALIQFNRDLITDDGMKDYGTCVDLISLISEREYQDYREYISDKSDWWWTLTARSASRSHIARLVDTDGCFGSSYACNWHNGVSPLFLIKADTLVKIIQDKAESDEI